MYPMLIGKGLGSLWSPIHRRFSDPLFLSSSEDKAVAELLAATGHTGRITPRGCTADSCTHIPNRAFSLLGQGRSVFFEHFFKNRIIAV